ncbi:hypothetical protein KUCAC02_025041 [Chaenocephalus aceratus]|nr:hypothetical protein KUCAC02_025041 [Chaenocephalus aceratus]
MAAVKLLTVVLLNFSSRLSRLCTFTWGTPRGNASWRRSQTRRCSWETIGPGCLTDRETNPNDKLLLSRSHGSEGSFRVRSKEPGGYQICLQANCSQHPLPAGVLLCVPPAGGSPGPPSGPEKQNHYAEIAEREKLMAMQLRVRQLIELFLQIQQEQN